MLKVELFYRVNGNMNRAKEELVTSELIFSKKLPKHRI